MSETLLDTGGGEEAPAAAEGTLLDTSTTETITPDPGVATDATTETAAAPTDTGEVLPDSAPATGDDWASVRTRIANGDEKILNRLSRYSTADDALKAGLEAQNKIAAGLNKAAKVPGADSTEAEVKAYREANGIPDTAKGYNIELPDGVVLGEEDQPVADAFVEVAHKHNLPPAVVNDIIANQMKLQNAQQADQAAADEKQRVVAEETLTDDKVWGSESKLNINMINQMLVSAPKGVKDQIMGARLADGTMLGNDVDALRWLANTARTLNPYATVTPGAGQSSADSVAGEISKLNTMMGDKTSEYWKGPSADKNQARYRDLVNMQNLAKDRAKK